MQIYGHAGWPAFYTSWEVASLPVANPSRLANPAPPRRSKDLRLRAGGGGMVGGIAETLSSSAVKGERRGVRRPAGLDASFQGSSAT